VDDLVGFVLDGFQLLGEGLQVVVAVGHPVQQHDAFDDVGRDLIEHVIEHLVARNQFIEHFSPLAPLAGTVQDRTEGDYQ